VTKARERLGFRAEVPIEDGIERYVSWFREQHDDLAALLRDDVARNWEVETAR
jgi:dTDP-D-glucose 4,6-dehydratase